MKKQKIKETRNNSISSATQTDGEAIGSAGQVTEGGGGGEARQGGSGCGRQPVQQESSLSLCRTLSDARLKLFLASLFIILSEAAFNIGT